MRSMGSIMKTADMVNHQLMHNNITRDDLDELISFLQQPNPRLTQGEKVRQFEHEWSDWLGIKHSVFVNSGSSANLISLAVLRDVYGVGEVIVPPLTWVSDIAATLQNGFTPIFVDINPATLAMDTDGVLEKINEETRAVFLTHAQGFNGLTSKLLDGLEANNIPLVEDVCESHGATFAGKKAGQFGLMSNFSFYFAHHITTIEGGMVCTDDDDVYQRLLMYRSHGMVRESTDLALKHQYAMQHDDLNPDFIFAMPAYNVRNTELSAVLGINQLKRLDRNNENRIHNHSVFLDALDKSRFRTEFEIEGSCNYAFNVVLRNPDLDLRDRIEHIMDARCIEYRRGSAGGGNQLRQPYLQDTVKELSLADFPEVDHVHFFGWYIGNYPELSPEKTRLLAKILNEV